MTFAAFAELCRRLEATRSRLAKTRETADALRQMTPDEIPWAVAFLSGRPFPASDPRVLDVSWGTLSALGPALETAPAAATLTLEDVARAFARVAEARGPGSRATKVAALRQLFAQATAGEREALGRLLRGEMRIGLHEGLIQEAIAEAAAVDPALVRRALLFVADPAVVAAVALAEGAAGLRTMGIRLFVPVSPMLAEPSDDIAAVLRAHGGRTGLEFKYDGARLQFHKADGTVRIWSRRLTEVTGSLPDVVAVLREAVRADPCILDGEVVAVGPDRRPLPFQELMRRLRRVHGVEVSTRETPLTLHLFDCLWVGGRSLIDEPYEMRWATLAELTDAAYLARRTIVADARGADAFLAEALARGHEGIMAKALDSPYTPGSRGKRWFKLKTAATIDCVIVAADRGSGRRQGWLSNYHLAVRDEAGGFAPVGKTFKGLTDAEFAAMTARLAALAEADDGYTITVRPEVVVEVTYNEIQESPQYSSGFALRFARITRIRDDKAPADASTLGELRTLYARQFATKARRGRG
jgi:DNA ligase 1